jgi:uncharacterized protein (TIGR00297 family)
MEHLDWLVRIGLSLAANLCLGLAGLLTRAFDRSGLLAGVAFGGLITYVFGPGGFLMVAAFVVLGTLSTRARLQRKIALGISRPEGSTRTWKNALANLGVPAFGALLTLYKPLPLLEVFTTAALATATFDVVATEIGKAFSAKCLTVRDLKIRDAGAPGGISAIGTASGVAAAVGVALVANGFGLVEPGMMVFVVVSALLASASESALKSASGVRSAHAANVTTTLLGGLIAVLFAQNF